MITVQTARFGADLLDAFSTAVADAKERDPMAPVTVITADNIAALTLRRYLAHGVGGVRGVAALTVTTIPRLAEQLASDLIATHRPTARVVLAASVADVLRSEPGVFVGVADNDKTIDALVSAHRTLRDVQVLDDADAVLDQIGAASALAADVVRIHRAVSARLADDCYDEVDLLISAAGELTEPRIRELGTVVVAPRELPHAHAHFLRELGARTSVLILAAEIGIPRIDDELRSDLAALGAEPGEQTAAAAVLDVAAEVLHASDPDDEVRAVVRRVEQRLQEQPGHRIAVLYSKRVPYARLCHEHLGNVGVTVNGPGVRPVLERSAVRAFLSILTLHEACGRAEVMKALAIVRLRDLRDDHVRPTYWDRLSRDAEVLGTADDSARGDWEPRLTALADALRSPGRGSKEPTEGQLKRADETDRLRTFIADLQGRLEAIASQTSWSGCASHARDLLHALLGAPGDRSGLPREEVFALGALDSALDHIGQLDEFSTGANLARLLELLTAQLGAAIPRVGRFGEGIFVGPLSAAPSLAVDTVYILGLSEDLYPGRISDDPLLPESLRRQLDGAIPLRRARISRMQRDLAAAFGAGRHVVAAFSRGDLRNTAERLPSRWLLPTLNTLVTELPPDATAVQATNWDKAQYRDVSAIASYDRELKAAPMPATSQELRIRHAASNTLDDATVTAANELITARGSDAFTRFDGNLAGEAGLPSYAGNPGVNDNASVAPTTLEGYVSCPHAFFINRILGIRPLSEPGVDIEVSPMVIGNLIHYTVDRFTQRIAAESTLPGPGQPWSSAHRAQIFDVFDEVVAEHRAGNLLGDPGLWEEKRTQLEEALRTYLDDDDFWRAEHNIAVHASELAFGLWDDEKGAYSAPVEIPIGNGAVLRMRGSADRVDVGADGTIYVTDLKTGSSRRFGDISQTNPTVGGDKLQLPVYAYAARAALEDSEARAVAQYWFLVRENKRIQLDVDDALTDEYESVLRTIVDSIAGGLYPARTPDDDDFAFIQCEYCNPDGLGYVEARRRWLSKSRAPELAGYTKLIQGENK